MVLVSCVVSLFKVDLLEQLLELEHEYGTLPVQSSALQDVLHYLEMVYR